MSALKIARACFVFSATAVLAACNQPAAQQVSAPPPPEVTVVTAAQKELPVSFEYVGQTAGVREVEVRPRVSGILLKWNYVEGARVGAGQSLFQIDPAPYQATLARVEADLASAEARLAQTTRDAARLKPLHEAKAISQKDYDDAVSAQEIAAADVKSKRAQVTEARLNLQYTRVEAPISGISSRAQKSEGSLVEAQQTLLTTITQVDPLYVIFSIPDAEHLKLQHESTAGTLRLPRDGRFDVHVKLADGTEYARMGKVNFTDVRVDPQTGTIDARAVIPNPDLKLRPGQFVRVRLSGAMRPHAITVPQRAVLEGPNGKIVMTVNDKGMVEPRPVTVGDWAGENWVITGGLKPGDKVIVDGVVKARPGSPVRVAQAQAEAVQPSAAVAQKSAR
ncbi:MAG TPA: efflux RND transporter periplasmic adaptor subunit [Burkholderiales bacterium]|nr:efflux RND transporter periplasmic adaptor subunit [Burkholderiales bacterium]